MLLDVSAHACALNRQIDYGFPLKNNGWVLASNWLSLAGAVTKVEIDMSRHNPNIGWCGQADDFDDAHSATLAEFTLALTRFNFVWGALESVMGLLPETPNVARLKWLSNSAVNSTLLHLSKNFTAIPPDHYIEIAFTLYGGEKRTKFDKMVLKDLGPCAIGLHVVRSLRNRLAHGDYHFPLPDEWGPGNENTAPHPESEHVDRCSRVVLLTIQMLVSTMLRSTSHMLPWERDDDGNEIYIPAWQAILHTHLEPIASDYDQMPLFTIEQIFFATPKLSAFPESV